MSEEEISTRVVVILLVPVVVAVGIMGYIIVDSLQVRQPSQTGPEASVIFNDHADQLNRTASGDRIVRARLEGEDAVYWSDLRIDIIDPRAEAVIVSFGVSNWTVRRNGQTIGVYTNGSTPREGEALTPGQTFVLRDVHDDQDASDDIINPCASFVFEARHEPTDTVLGTFKKTFVAADWAPGVSCDDVNG